MVFTMERQLTRNLFFFPTSVFTADCEYAFKVEQYNFFQQSQLNDSVANEIRSLILRKSNTKSVQFSLD